MSQEDLTYLASDKIIKKIALPSREELFFKAEYDVKADQIDKKVTHTEKQLQDKLLSIALKYGSNSFLNQLTAAELTTLYKPHESPSIEDSEKGKKKNKFYLTKKLSSVILDGPEKYFASLRAEDVEILDDFFNCELVADSDECGAEAVEELTLLGLEIFLHECNVKVLGEICADMKLKVTKNSPNSMIQLILTGKAPVETKKAQPEKVVNFSKVKKPLAKGLSFHDIHQHYLLEELKEFCKKHKIKTTGTKREVINRIIDYFDGTLQIREEAKAKRKADKAAARQKKLDEKKAGKAASAAAESDSEDESESEDEAAEEAEEVVLEQHDTDEEASKKTTVTKMKKQPSLISPQKSKKKPTTTKSTKSK
eukprot:gene11108-13592_t